ncbi:MAG: DUF3108 domain-containing protein [Rhodocyclaceae bacterium]|nr:DUF3108 domain-containing protein [Rhodocyclaceae bacterium]MBL0076484.1 DUF3108 domain-containing protein [Rhodocyclaceae bacterium]MBP6109639.1 DUF3108 domain-containing protein [Rhodocyclaceae bacterium]MBP6278889.1 DUF3108 domain-containing protein [Rhodocyclaceae bacterium]
MAIISALPLAYAADSVSTLAATLNSGESGSSQSTALRLSSGSAVQSRDSTPLPTGEANKVANFFPREGSLEYTVMRGDGGFVLGKARHEWHFDGKSYSLKSSVETTGLAALLKSIKAVQQSRGELTAGGLKPQEFTQERGKGLEQARFDWVRGTVKNGEVEDALIAGTQDVLSVYYQLAWLSPIRGAVEIPIATGRKLDRYRFEVIGEETLSLEDGPQQVTHLRGKTTNDTMDLWFAPRLSPLPLRITLLNSKGELYDQRVKRIAR